MPNHKNFAQTTLAAAITTTDGTSITVTSEASFPAANFIISIDTECLLVTNVATTTWTVTRGYEGSTAATHLNGAAVYHDWSAGEADSTVHGPASATSTNLAVFDGTTGKLIKDGGACTAAGLALLDDATAADQLTTLGAAPAATAVVGPASATDNAIVRYDATTGKLVQNSLVVIDDTGHVGINVTAPDAELTVKTTGLDGLVSIYGGAGGAGWDYGVIQVHSAGSLANSTGPRPLNINPNGGFVGIGTATAPSSQLDVTGNLIVRNSSPRVETLVASTDAAALSGTELVTNGTFTTDLTGWTAGANWAQSAGVAAATAGAGTMVQSVSLTTGKRYQVSFSLVRTAGTMVLTFGSMEGSFSFTGTETCSRTFTCSSTASYNLTFTPDASFAGSIDDVSVQEVTGTNGGVLFVDNTDGSSGIQFRAGGASKGNTFIGISSGLRNRTSLQNTGVGGYALQNISCGYQNVATGYNSLGNLTNGYQNVAVGCEAGVNLTNGYRNIAIGLQALYNGSQVNHDVAIGYTSMHHATTASENIAVGTGTGHNLSTGNCNVIVGMNAAWTATTSNYTVAVGQQALYALTTGNNNAGIGAYSFEKVTTGGSNVGVGYNSGCLLTTGSDNTFIGRSAGANASQKVDVVNSTAIGHDAYTTADNQMVFGDANVTEIWMSQDKGATVIAGKYQLGALNTAPSSATDTGTLGEIRIVDGYIYVCTATNTWKRVAIATW